MSFIGVVALGVALAAGFGEGDKPVVYPETKRVDHIDEYHGAKIPDPYRWLEDDVRKAPEVRKWVDAQNAVTQDYLKAIPQRETIRRRLTELWNYERFTAPQKDGGRYFYSRNDGLQNQSVLYVVEKLDGKPRVLLDPNTWSKDGTVALAGLSISDDGRLAAYGVAEAGSDWSTWKVIDVDTGKVTGDEIKWVKFSSPSWTKDGRGFFYSRYDEPKPGQQFQSLNLNQRVMFHVVGKPQSEDVVFYKRPDHPEWGFSTTVTEDGRYAIITTWKGTDDRYRVTYRDLHEPLAMPTDLIDNFEFDYTFVDNEGPVFYFRTDWKAPRGQLIAIDTRQPEQKNWQTVIAETKDKLLSVSSVGNLFAASYLQDAKSAIALHKRDGAELRKVQLPGIGTAAGFAGRRTDSETFYTFSSYDTPPSIFRYDLLTGESKLFRQAKVKFNPSEYVVEQTFYTSKDGTKVPMFLAHRKGIKLDGTNPTLLYGYGGFNIPLTPSFSIPVVEWMELGGVYAVANLRGGGEYGKEWHKAGTKLKKQNVFDDFIAAAEHLIAKKYTSREKLAVQGGSNGGLLVGAAITQRPDLFAAALPAVGVMDMLRFHKFTAGRFWVDDYGSADNYEEFQALKAYSPYHNLKPGTKYPATMVITADTDDRVVPGHSFKFAAAMQQAQAGKAPVLARIATRAGHGAGKPLAKQIEEVADQWAFLVKNLGVEK